MENGELTKQRDQLEHAPESQERNVFDNGELTIDNAKESIVR
jgi:hypothetical protein